MARKSAKSSNATRQKLVDSLGTHTGSSKSGGVRIKRFTAPQPSRFDTLPNPGKSRGPVGEPIPNPRKNPKRPLPRLER